MKTLKYSFFILIIIFLFNLFATTSSKSGSTSNHITKLKALTQAYKLIKNNYVENPNMEDVIDGAIIGLLEALDPHSSYLTSDLLEKMQEDFSGEFEGIGIEFSIIDGYITVISPIPETPSDRAGLISGDKIVKIDGKSAYKITQQDVFDELRGPKNSRVNLTIRRNNVNDFEVILLRDKIPIRSVLASFMIDDVTGYVKINRFSHNTYTEFNEALNNLEDLGMTQLMIDLRNNPGGLMNQAVDMVDMFVNSRDTILFTKGRIPGASRYEKASPGYSDKSYPVVTLINRGSASASEIVSGAFQDLDRGIVVGETSFGKGSVQNLFTLNDGSAIKLTVAKYYTPSGRSIQRPYDNGLDEYYLDLSKENREQIEDSLLTNKPIFYTKNGRVVYGGGGITPDIYIDSDLELSSGVSNFIVHPDRLLFNFADKIKNEDKDIVHSILEDIEKIKDWERLKADKLSSKLLNTFIKDYHLSIDNKNDLIIILKDLDEEFKDQDLDNDWNYIENRIKAQIANAIWGKSEMYKVNLYMDKVAIEGLKQFESARLLIKQN